MYGKCLSLAKSSEFDIGQCIIWQKKSKVSLTLTENGRKKIIDAAAIRKDEVYQRLQNGNIDEILSTRHQFLLQKLYVEEDIGISLCKFYFLDLCH